MNRIYHLCPSLSSASGVYFEINSPLGVKNAQMKPYRRKSRQSLDRNEKMCYNLIVTLGDISAMNTGRPPASWTKKEDVCS